MGFIVNGVDQNKIRRRPAATTTRLLWECQEASGDVINTGSLASAGDLTAGAALVRRAFSFPSTIGSGIRCKGTSTSEATGAAGEDPGTSTAVTMWGVVVVRAWPAGVSAGMVVCRDYAAPGSPWVAPYGTAVMIRAGGALVAAASISGVGYSEVVASSALSLDQQHLVGLTYDGATLTAWADGVAVATLSVSASIDWGSAGAWHLGGAGSGGDFLTGIVLRAGVEAEVWDATDWNEQMRHLCGDPES